GFGFEDGFANIPVIGNYHRAVCQQNFGTIYAVERRAATGAVREMASNACQLGKQLLAGSSWVDLANLARKPRSIVRGIHDRYPASHDRVIGAAILRAKQTIPADFGGAEPQDVVASRHEVHLDAERRIIEICNYFFASQDELDFAIHVNMELVDFAAAVRLLQPPHPLLADHVDVQRVFGRQAKVHVNHGAPGKHDQSDEQGHCG